MRKIHGVLACLFLVSCGSAKEIGELKDALTDDPVTAPSPTPTAVPQAKKDAFEEYRKIAEGMKREEIMIALGEPSQITTKKFCDNGKCGEYEYLHWIYDGHRIGVTIQFGIAVYTYCN